MEQRESAHRGAGLGQKTILDRRECPSCGRDRNWTLFCCDGETETRRYVSLDAAVEAIIERFCDTSRGILCSDFRRAADFLREEFGSSSKAGPS